MTTASKLQTAHTAPAYLCNSISDSLTT